MLPDYSDFINNNPHYKQLSKDSMVEQIFNFLLEPEQIAKMIKASLEGRPALAPVARDLEVKFPDFLKLPYNDYLLRQSAGTMIREILEPFGFTPNEQKRIPVNQSSFFKTSHNYNYDKQKAKYKIVTIHKIESIT